MPSKTKARYETFPSQPLLMGFGADPTKTAVVLRCFPIAFTFLCLWVGWMLEISNQEYQEPADGGTQLEMFFILGFLKGGDSVQSLNGIFSSQHVAMPFFPRLHTHHRFQGSML